MVTGWLSDRMISLYGSDDACKNDEFKEMVKTVCFHCKHTAVISSAVLVSRS